MTLTNVFRNLFSSNGWATLKVLPKFWVLLSKSGKTVEFSSFVIWELYAKFKLFKKSIIFDKKAHIILDKRVSSANAIFDSLKDSIEDDKNTLHKSEDWQMIYISEREEIWGFLKQSNNVLSYSPKNRETVLAKYHFPKKIKSLFITKNRTIFVSSNGLVYRSIDNGDSFEEVLAFSHPESFFLLHNGMTETDNSDLLLGEYANVWDDTKGWTNVANLYYSFENGKTWGKSNFLQNQGVNKHIHIVKYIKNMDKLILTDGDNKKQIWVNDSPKDAHFATEDWKLLTNWHFQMGGYTAAIEQEDKVILGTDYWGGSNFIITTSDFKHFEKELIPDPFRRSMVGSLQKVHSTLWAILYPPFHSSARGLLMKKEKGAKHWTKVIEFDGHIWKVSIISEASKEANQLFINVWSQQYHQYYVFQIHTKST